MNVFIAAYLFIEGYCGSFIVDVSVVSIVVSGSASAIAHLSVRATTFKPRYSTWSFTLT